MLSPCTGSVGRFSIASHSWDELFMRVVEASKNKKFRLVTPKTGEPLRLDGVGQAFDSWWEDVKLRYAFRRESSAGMVYRRG